MGDFDAISHQIMGNATGEPGCSQLALIVLLKLFKVRIDRSRPRQRFCAVYCLAAHHWVVIYGCEY